MYCTPMSIPKAMRPVACEQNVAGSKPSLHANISSTQISIDTCGQPNEECHDPLLNVKAAEALDAVRWAETTAHCPGIHTRIVHAFISFT
jgi:hypothetical protein